MMKANKVGCFQWFAFNSMQLAWALRLRLRLSAFTSGLEYKGGTSNALDNFCRSSDLMVTRHGFQFHSRRVYSSASGDSAGDVVDSVNHRPSTGSLSIESFSTGQ